MVAAKKFILLGSMPSYQTENDLPNFIFFINCNSDTVLIPLFPKGNLFLTFQDRLQCIWNSTLPHNQCLIYVWLRVKSTTHCGFNYTGYKLNSASIKRWIKQVLSPREQEKQPE